MSSIGTSRESTPTPATYGTGGSNRQLEPSSNLLSMDPREAARIHYLEFKQYLASCFTNKLAGPRPTTRQKLTSLARQRFGELTTDVYEELLRRNNTENEVPFLFPRDDFHPQRNLARQKLSTLSTGGFTDLASDVHHELSRRYPELTGVDEKSMSAYSSNGSPGRMRITA
ncbi:hypothetical protein DAEQUDRAFT_764449 [Daedalea quercina L-15889]|uniref:GIT Spa2 homology (SHD) domain-containing protein n=1 Tax=Daedalea quercina L-15889 TaxID=1314783 RepID=A0A165RBU3_9APHY|nr:hypothetical protein DAEQUDRAFT_764449 [Daedalea quercina L-15889]